MSAIRPIFAMREEGVDPAHYEAILRGVRKMLALARVEHQLEIRDLDVWRQSDWLQGDELTQWNSVDWYVTHAREYGSRDGQLNGELLLSLLSGGPWRQEVRHYDIFVTDKDLYDGTSRFCVGLAACGSGAVISPYRFSSLDPILQQECLVTEAMHEIGHVFGLVPDERRDNAIHSLGSHCTNQCVMQQGLHVPDDWIAMTRNRFMGHELCDVCSADLVQFFAD